MNESLERWVIKEMKFNSNCFQEYLDYLCVYYSSILGGQNTRRSEWRVDEWEKVGQLQLIIYRANYAIVNLNVISAIFFLFLKGWDYIQNLVHKGSALSHLLIAIVLTWQNDKQLYVFMCLTMESVIQAYNVQW